MKLLRILTGHHAGAQVVLAPGAHRIGQDDDADIQLTDWRGPDVLLTMDDSGAVCSERIEENASALDPCKTWMIDFVPMQFDDTVICIGWADAAWPSDIALLSTLLNGPSEASGDEVQHGEGSKRRRYAGIAVACAAVGVAAVGISFALTTGVSRAAIAPPDVQMEQRLNHALQEAHLNELHIAPDGAAGDDGAPHVIATGMVRTASDDYIARQLFDRMKPGIVTRRYGVADDTARGIRDALGIDGIDVKYDGQGVFTLSGTVADKQHVEQALDRVRGDFGKRIREIRVALTDVAQPAPAPKKGTYIALVSSGEVQYAQTPDGVKHIYTTPQYEAEAASEAAPDLPH